MRIIWMSDHPALNTGFARVTREVVGRLASARSDYEIRVLGWHLDRPATLGAGCQILPGGRDFGRSALPRLIDRFEPDAIIALGNIWMIDWLERLKPELDARLIVHFPLDSAALPPRWLSFLRQADVPVPCSDSARVLLDGVCPGLETRTFGVNWKKEGDAARQ